jgi:hypothetical protein
LPFLQIPEVSQLVNVFFGSSFSFASDTKTNVQTYVALDEIKSWLQRKKEGMF